MNKATGFWLVFLVSILQLTDCLNETELWKQQHQGKYKPETSKLWKWLVEECSIDDKMRPAALKNVSVCLNICKISISKRVEKTHNPPVPSLLPWLPCHNLSLASSVKLKTHSYWSTDQTPLFVLVCLGVGNNQSKDRCWDVSICRNWKSGTKVWLYPPVRGKNVPIIVFFFFSNQVSLFLPKSTCGGNIPVWNGAVTLKLVNGTKSHDFQ